MAISPVLGKLTHMWHICKAHRAHIWTLDIGQLDMDNWTIGHWTRTIGQWTIGRGHGHWTLDIGRGILDVGYWTMDVGCWTFEERTANTRS